MRRMRALVRWIFVTAGVILLTSITVDATLSPNGFSQSALGILASNAVPKTTCPSGMVEHVSSDGRLCVDVFESAPGADCPLSEVRSELDTRTNIDTPGCVPLAEEGSTPWTHVTFHQAEELCARVGKRLPTSDEWYRISLGTPDSLSAPVCNIRSGTLVQNDGGSDCVNGTGIYNAIGNAWEWIDGTVSEGTFEGRTLPESGYVADIDRYGVAQVTSATPSDQLYRDYLWSDTTGEYGMLRGGFFGSGDDAGLYSVQAKTPLSFSSGAIGFRCIDDLTT